jgi:hypothetical protein
MVAGPLSLGVSLIVQRDLTMPLRSRRMVLESLESRQLLSVSPTSAEVSTLAKPKQFKESGTLTGSLTTVLAGTSFVANGDVGTLGAVQLQSLVPHKAHAKVAFTLTTAQGTMTFNAKPTAHQGYTLTLKKQHTGAYAGWTGTGTLTLRAVGPSVGPTGAITNPGSLGSSQPATFSLKLTLKA